VILSADVYGQVESLVLVANLEDLDGKLVKATTWAEQPLAAFNGCCDDVPLRLKRHVDMTSVCQSRTRVAIWDVRGCGIGTCERPNRDGTSTDDG
jgi:hypothetical protein